jgi:hypothetical protein
MRTLVDLLNDELGYVRIFAEPGGYAYELSTYRPRPIADLFERMGGYASLGAASEAARYQLCATHSLKRVSRRRAR